jgi:hypothetical protein
MIRMAAHRGRREQAGSPSAQRLNPADHLSSPQRGPPVLTVRVSEGDRCLAARKRECFSVFGEPSRPHLRGGLRAGVLVPPAEPAVWIDAVKDGDDYPAAPDAAETGQHRIVRMRGEDSDMPLRC